VLGRHRFPAGALVGAGVFAAAGGFEFLLLVGLGYSAGHRVRSHWRLAAALLGALTFELVSGWRNSDGSIIGSAVFSLVIFVVLGVFPAVVARLSAQRRQIVTLLHERTLFLSQQQQVTAEQARTREAARIAREMHDSLGHRLTLLSMYTGALRSQPEKSAETLEILHTTSQSAIEELRNILHVLRSPDQETHPRTTLAEVDALISDTQSTGARIELLRTGTPVPLPAMVDHAAYRTLQEGITNALKHARGGAIRAALRYEEDALIAEVANAPGAPHDGPSSGQGLYGLAERIRLAGGVLFHGPEGTGGFRIAATLPLTDTAPREFEPAVPEALGRDLRRADQRRRAWVVVLAVSVAGVFLLCVGGLWLFWQKGTVSQETYHRIPIGVTVQDAHERLPESMQTNSDRPAPPGQKCENYLARGMLSGSPGAGGYRFCFRDGTLVSKEEVDDGG
jgi:signal transduction histidine kinase